MIFPLKLKVYKEVAEKHAVEDEKQLEEKRKFADKFLDNKDKRLHASTDLICSIAQNIPEFLDMVASSLQRDKNDP